MNQKKSGLTLMEVLIALFIFSFSSIYISRTINHLLKRQKKVEKEIKSQRSHSNIMEVLRQDLRGVLIHFDINFHLNRWAYSELSKISEEKKGGRVVPFEGRNFMNPQFDFFGEENQLIFTSLIPFTGNRESKQLVKINYFFKQCKNPATEQMASCLIRGVSRHWKDRQDVKSQKNRVLIRDLKEGSFSYYHPEKKEWENTWNFLSFWKRGVLRPTQYTALLPLSVQINMDWGEKSSSYLFSVSQPLLRTVRPGTLSPLVYLRAVNPSSPFSTDKDKDTPKEEEVTPSRTPPASPETPGGSDSPPGSSIPSSPPSRQ